jgi:hypothetical protein
MATCRCGRPFSQDQSVCPDCGLTSDELRSSFPSFQDPEALLRDLVARGFDPSLAHQSAMSLDGSGPGGLDDLASLPLRDQARAVDLREKLRWLEGEALKEVERDLAASTVAKLRCDPPCGSLLGEIHATTHGHLLVGHQDHQATKARMTELRSSLGARIPPEQAPVRDLVDFALPEDVPRPPLLVTCGSKRPHTWRLERSSVRAILEAGYSTMRASEVGTRYPPPRT